jgi:hypothetical protein
MTQIIGFAGKKQSGKNTCCNFIIMLKLIEDGVCKKAKINDAGVIEVSDIFGERSGKANGEYFPFQEPYVNVEAVMGQMKSVKMYALADPLKRIAIDVLGLPEDKVYGTDDDKNEPTNLKWKDMPKKVHGKNGFMTIREVLQYLGTDIFRKIYNDIWIDALLRKIEFDSPQIALVCDVRFENEIKLLKKRGAIIVGLSRDYSKGKDNHASEKVNLSLCHKIIKNDDLNIPEQNKSVYFTLKELGCKNLTDLGV